MVGFPVIVPARPPVAHRVRNAGAALGEDGQSPRVVQAMLALVRTPIVTPIVALIVAPIVAPISSRKASTTAGAIEDSVPTAALGPAQILDVRRRLFLQHEGQSMT